MTDEKLKEEIIALVLDHSGHKREKITTESRFLDDLGIDGDDGYELLTDFMEKFNVDIGSLEYNRHFGPEGLDISGCLMFFPLLLLGLISLVFPPLTIKNLENEPDMEPLTVQDMIDAAKAGKWVKYYPPKLEK